MGLSLMSDLEADLTPLAGNPVYDRHRRNVDDAFEASVAYLAYLQRIFSVMPDADAALDAAMPHFHELLTITDQALGRFRATRDCTGSS